MTIRPALSALTIGLFAAVFAVQAKATEQEPYKMICYQQDDESEVCGVDAEPAEEDDSTVAGAKPTVASTNLKASELVTKTELSGGATDIANQFEFDAVAEDSSAAPGRLARARDIALNQILRAQSVVRQTEDYLRNDFPNTREIRVNISKKQ